MYQKLNMEINETQFGFREGLKTSEAFVFAFNVLFERCLGVR